MSEALVREANDALEVANRSMRQAPRKALRFFQFFRAYMRGFAEGFVVFLLMNELTSGHFNIVQSILTHVFAIIAAPFYAIAMAPTLYGLYSMTRLLPVREEHRAYALAVGIGLLFFSVSLPRPGMSQAEFSTGLLFTAGVLVACLVAAHRFNAVADRLRSETIPSEPAASAM